MESGLSSKTIHFVPVSRPTRSTNRNHNRSIMTGRSSGMICRIPSAESGDAQIPCATLGSRRNVADQRLGPWKGDPKVPESMGIAFAIALAAWFHPWYR